MLSILVLALLFGAVRTLVSLTAAWRSVPRSNDDLVFF